MAASEFDDRDLWPVLAGVGEIVYPPGGSFGPRLQNNVQLVMLHTGEMTVWIDGVKFFSPAGTVCLLLPGHQERFAFAQERETHHSWLHASMPDLPDAWRKRLVQLPWSLPLSPLMNSLISQSLQLSHSFRPTAPEMLKALAAQMLWLYIGEGEGPIHTTQPPLISQALQFIQARLGESLTLEQIANTVGVSPAHLIRLFQKHLGMTVMAFVWEQRVKLGIELLSNTGLGVAVIAERCGFQNSFHFSRRIRLATGFSPLEVRSRLWGH
ncbi:MAG: AraC family transcriptional regulator [Chloroflexi bacterium]|nr:AraC family transcriptional regulator [Chloroflexota bacterium]